MSHAEGHKPLRPEDVLPGFRQRRSHVRRPVPADSEAGRELVTVLERLALAADQVQAWVNEHESLVRQAYELGATQHEIAPPAQVAQSTVSRMLARDITP
ncbi:hypothetical protein ACFYOT_21950 [Saccharothrix saharensis]|uniref:hypothetical protein n=1 Tax=Saccharothrix saharensis TaxID=571190 RepID=UPI0036A0C003